MKRFVCIALLLLLAAVPLAACRPQESPPTVHVCHNGVIYSVPIDTTGVADLDPSRLKDAVIIPSDRMPTREGEVNVDAASVQIYDLDERHILVIIDGTQYLVPLDGPAGNAGKAQSGPEKSYIYYGGELWEIDPEETISMDFNWYEENKGYEYIDAVLIDPNETPSKELECNAKTDRARIHVWENGSITVILGDTGHMTRKVK